MGLKQFAGCGAKVFQLEVTVAFEREAEALGGPLPAPQHVLAEAARAGAHVGEIEQLAVSDQRPLKHVTRPRNTAVT